MSPSHLLTTIATPLSCLIAITVFIISVTIPPVTSVKEVYYPPNGTYLRREFFYNGLSFITVASVWVFFLIIFIVFRLYYLDERSKLHQVFDDCSPSTTQYKYLVRLRVGKSSPIFQKDTSAIMIDLLDPRHCFITRLSVSPSWLKADVYSRQSPEKPRLRSLKFVLNRANQMPIIGAIRIAHDSYFPVGGYIFLHSVEIRNLTENTLTQIPIFKRIFVLPPDASDTEQVYSARSPFTNKREDDNLYTSGYAPTLAFPELLCFSFFYSNVTLFTTLFVPTCIEISNFQKGLFNGLAGILPSSFVTLLLLFFYRYFVKKFYSQAKAKGPWSVVRIIFLTTLTLNGLVVGLTSAFIQSRQTSHTLTYWSLAILIANFSVVAIIVPILTAILIYQIFSTRANPRLMLAPSFTSKVVDETQPDDEKRSSIIRSLMKNRKSLWSSMKNSMVDEPSKDKISKLKRSDQRRYEVKSNKTEDDKFEKLVGQKKSMEEGLLDRPNDPKANNIKGARDLIISRLQSALGRSSKEPNSQGEEKIFDIDNRMEKRAHEQ